MQATSGAKQKASIQGGEMGQILNFLFKGRQGYEVWMAAERNHSKFNQPKGQRIFLEKQPFPLLLKNQNLREYVNSICQVHFHVEAHLSIISLHNSFPHLFLEFDAKWNVNFWQHF